MFIIIYAEVALVIALGFTGYNCQNNNLKKASKGMWRTSANALSCKVQALRVFQKIST